MGTSAREAEVGAAGGPPLARGGSASDREQRFRRPPRLDATVVGLALRSALNARPTGSQGCAEGQANDKDHNKNKNKNQNKKGTLLMR